jgi:hypothetical protein
MCFFNSAEKGYLERRETISSWKNLSCRKYCYQNITEFSQGNNVQNAVASNTDGLFCSDICVSSTELICLFEHAK